LELELSADDPKSKYKAWATLLAAIHLAMSLMKVGSSPPDTVVSCAE
jgi:hypothetical protein